MLSLDQLRDLKLSQLTEQAREWADISNRAYASRERVTKEIVSDLSETQKSEASFFAVVRLGRLANNYQYIHTECGLVAASLNGLAEELAPLQRTLLNALDDAKQAGFEVFDDGSVRYPAAKAGDTELLGDTVSGNSGFFSQAMGSATALATQNPNALRAQGIADAIAGALSQATEIDEQYAQALRRLKAEEGLDVTESTWADVSGDATAVHSAADDVLKENIPTDRPQAERKEWWDNLSDAERVEYLAVYPDVIGNLDGIPAVARDEANRLYLPQLMGELAAKGDEDSMTKLAGLKEIDAQLQTAGEPPMYLLGVGDEGNGRAIVSYGNPDAAKNVSSYVPGLNTKLDAEFATDPHSTMRRAYDTAVAARQNDPSSASIVWLGYDAPQSATEVMSEENAERGASAYDGFMSGISATNENADPHITAIGHSYGSLTVGKATQEPGGIPGVDDIVLVGSPGVGVNSAEDLGVAKDHVWVGAADNDVVTHLPSKSEVAGGVFGGAVAGIPGAVVGSWLGDPDGDDVWFGKDPASSDFGANRFQAGDGPFILNPEFPDVRNSGIDFGAHSQYFNPEKDQVSTANIGAIVAGDYQRVIREDSR
ncbi:alpha/beta hydrolase [Streptomyces griseoaurantiacus]|uniref:alpha/beta hydrolase n=1 Tax=Streptomyces griseoaurantiacus TaxID=68213 RepID=UPI002E2CAA37|nr:alpha/beta hydrolase [Streptomyces jietaisiensis]